jgi:hypothetical protein
MLILANQFRLGSKLGSGAKSGVLGFRAEYLTISNIFQRVTRAKRIWPSTLRIDTRQNCSEIRMKRFEGGDERQTTIIFAILNLDSQTCRKSAFSLVSPDNAKQTFRQLHCDRTEKPPDHQDRLPVQ